MASSTDSAVGAASLRANPPSSDLFAADSNHWWHAGLQSTHIAIGIISLYDNRYVRANAAMARMCGVTLEELFELDPFTLALRVTHPDEMEQEQRLFGEMATGRRSFYEMEKRYQQPDGSARWGRLTFSAVYDPAPNSGVPAVPVKYVVLQIVDITRERELQAEVERRDAEMRHAQKVDQLGRLAAGIAHDFNNLLTVITGHGEVLRSQLEAPKDTWTISDLNEDVGAILAAAERAAGLTAQLLSHGRRENAAPRRFALSELVGTLERLLTRTLGSNIQIEHSLQAAGVIFADQG
jgi:two-component system, cell cycle sensor histidine kinase and response regulator CckA